MQNKNHPNKVIRINKNDTSRINAYISGLLKQIGDPNSKQTLQKSQIRLILHGTLLELVKKHGEYLGKGAWKVGKSFFRFQSNILTECVHCRFIIGRTPLGTVYGNQSNVSKKQFKNSRWYYDKIWFGQ